MNQPHSVFATRYIQPGQLGAVLSSKEHSVEEFERLKKIIADAEEDLRKAEGGNRAAGVRVRQAMQDLKNTAQDVRQKILEFRDGDKPQQ